MHICLTDSVRPERTHSNWRLGPSSPRLVFFFCQPSPQGPSGEKGPIGLREGGGHQHSEVGFPELRVLGRPQSQ